MLTAFLTLIFIRPFISSLAFPYADFIYSFLLLIFIVIWILAKGLHLKADSLASAIILLFIALSIPLIFRYNPAASPQELYKYISGVFLLLICCSLTYEDKNKVIFSLTAAGALISCLAIYQYFFGFQHLNSYIIREKISNPLIRDYLSQRRVFFPFISPNILGGYLAMIIPLALTFKNRSLLILPLFFALLLTRSLGALLSLSLALTLYYFLEGKFKKRNIFILLVLLAAIGTIFIARTQIHKEHLQPLFSTIMRLNYWEGTLAVIKSHPLTGTGLGNFNLAYSRYSHNSYLQLWAETGILGIISFIWLVIIILKRGLKNLRESPDKARSAALICCAFVFLIHNLIDFTFFLPEVSLIWWVILGALI